MIFLDITRLFRILLSIAVIVTYILLSRKNTRWRYIVYGPIVNAVLILMFYVLRFFNTMTPEQLNYFSAWISIVDVLSWLTLGLYKLRAPHANI